MNTLTLSAPQVSALLAAGFTAIRVSKSTSQTSAGPFSALTPDVSLVTNTTSYTFVDPLGVPGDWYITQYVQPPSTLSSASAPQPGYLTDICQAVRDLVGVASNETSDAVIQGFSFLPAALSEIRSRLANFDSLVVAGGDTAAACLAALAHLTAALLTARLSLTVMDMEIFRDYRYQRNKALSWTEIKNNLMERYEELISQAAGEVTANSTLMVPGVVFAGPSRGGYDTTGGLIPFDPPGGVYNPYPDDIPPEVGGSNDNDDA